MSTRNAIIELLHAGHSDKAIERQLNVSRLAARAIRHQRGLPTHKPGPAAANSPEDLFWRRVEPTSDGHLLWPGYSRQHGANINHGGRRHSVHRVAFRIGNRREPVGRVTTGCGTEGCVHPRHVEDQAMRNQYTAIFGEAA